MAQPEVSVLATQGRRRQPGVELRQVVEQVRRYELRRLFDTRRAFDVRPFADGAAKGGDS